MAFLPSPLTPPLPRSRYKSRSIPPMRLCNPRCVTTCFSASLPTAPAFFEQLIVDLLVAMGYGGSHKDAAAQPGRSGDGCVDGIVNEDRLGLDRIYVQAKRYAPGNAVGRPDVNGFVGLGATKGVFVTTSTFSQPARDYVRHHHHRRAGIGRPDDRTRRRRPQLPDGRVQATGRGFLR